MSSDALGLSPLWAFVRLSRPLFLYGGFAAVALGAAVARWSGHPVDLATYLWAQALVTSFHLMTHYANDYFDRESDVGAERTRWSGGSGVLVAGLLPPRVALVASLVFTALGLLASARFALAENAAVAWLGIAIFVFAWCYSAPPVRFAARGLGELDTALVVAMLFPFVGYAAFAGSIDGTILRVVQAPVFAMIAMMLCVELPDVGCDLRAGKRNLVVRFGPAQAWRLITIAASIALASAAATAYRTNAGIAMLALAPAAVATLVLIGIVRRDPRPGSTAFWGVTLYALIVTGLAAFYALSASA
jgi:1,4-dihydroxy-2-naphthoate polyprenyltransferase